MVKELKRRTAKTLELQSLNPAHADRTLAAADVAMDRADRVGEPVADPHVVPANAGTHTRAVSIRTS